MTLIEREESLLLVIDAQDNFYPTHRIDVDRYALGAAFDRTAWVALAAATLGVPTIATEEEPAFNGPTDQRISRNFASGAITLEKTYFSAADNPNIMAAIEATGRSTIVLTGLESDICVAHSALQLAARGFRVAVAHDAVFSPGAAHREGLRRMERAGIELLSAKGVFYDWIRNVDGLDDAVAREPRLRATPGFHL
ncbi:isochorismatase family protein [Microbacterium sp. NPDC089695]|uniref:isochorismatase family protein n=1 Tax=Microbacterium sp. NPDC089695 TaxID=3364198 RepID=UPI0037FD7202